jgi:hypothetical protein
MKMDLIWFIVLIVKTDMYNKPNNVEVEGGSGLSTEVNEGADLSRNFF